MTSECHKLRQMRLAYLLLLTIVLTGCANSGTAPPPRATVIIDSKDDLKSMQDMCDEARRLGQGGGFIIGDASTLEDAFLSATQGNAACNGVTFVRADRDSTGDEWRMRFTPVGPSPEVLRNQSRWL